jgi:transcriptional regulator with XRE-family HTH domain
MQNVSHIDAVSSRIAKRAGELGVSQADIVRATGASKSTVHGWFNNRNVPRGSYVTALCKILKCTHDWLMDGQGSPSLNAGSDVFAAIQGTWELDRDEKPSSPILKAPALKMSGELDYGDVICVPGLVASYVEKPDLLAWIEVRSRSAEPCLKMRDMAVVDSGSGVTTSGGYYVIGHSSGSSVHQIHVEIDGAWSVEDSARGMPSRVDKSQVGNVDVLGRVVWRSGAVS